MPLIRLDGAHDARLAVFSSMTDAELRDPKQLVGLARAIDAEAAASEQKPNHLESGLFIAESKNVIERAMEAGLEPFALLVEECWLDQSMPLIDRLLEQHPAMPAFVVAHNAMHELTGFERTRGALAAFHRPQLPMPSELLRASQRVAILEDITNFTNIGAIFRSAAALGIDAVLVTPRCHDPFYRRAARVSMGTVFQVPWTRIGNASDPNWTCAGIPLLREAGFKTAALALTDQSIPLQSKELQTCGKLAVVLGTEGDGLAARTIAACDYTVKIPMDHNVDSLNVAAASAVAFWELRTSHRD